MGRVASVVVLQRPLHSYFAKQVFGYSTVLYNRVCAELNIACMIALHSTVYTVLYILVPGPQQQRAAVQ